MTAGDRSDAATQRPAVPVQHDRRTAKIIALPSIIEFIFYFERLARRGLARRLMGIHHFSG
jgi:hypothetical protein